MIDKIRSASLILNDIDSLLSYYDNELAERILNSIIKSRENLGGFKGFSNCYDTVSFIINKQQDLKIELDLNLTREIGMTQL
jgi:hypothetical protein